MRKNKKTRCGKCGGNTPPLTAFANISTGESHYVCANCMSSQGIGQMENLADLDSQIEEIEKSVQSMEGMMKEMGDIKMDIPKGLESFMFTPLSAYKMAQMTLANLKTQRLHLLSQGENIERLQYEHDQLIAEEKYEEAGRIQQRITALKENKAAGKSKTISPSKKPKLSSMQEEEAVGKCPRCQKRFPAPPGLFYDFKIGKCREYCLACLVDKLPSKVKNLEMADEMIAELEKYIKFTAKLSNFGQGENLLASLGQPTSEGQVISQKLLQALKSKRGWILLKEGDVERFGDELDKYIDEMMGTDNPLAKELKNLLNARKKK